MTLRGYGITGALDHAITRELAAAAEQSGYDTFWSNDTPDGDGLAALAAAAPVTERIVLGVGVIPVDRMPPDRIAARIRELDLPLDRLVVGIGAGGVKSGSIDLMRNAILELRELVPCRIYLGALGPAMCRLGGELADGLLLNWLTPDQAVAKSGPIREAAAKAERPAPAIATYVRSALPPGTERLRSEAERYSRVPAYAEQFRRTGVGAFDTALSGDAAEIAAGLARFEGKVDEAVLRAITGQESIEAYLDLLRAGAPTQA